MLTQPWNWVGKQSQRFIGKQKSSSDAGRDGIGSEVVQISVLSDTPHKVNWLSHCHFWIAHERSVVDGQFITGTYTLEVEIHATVSDLIDVFDHLVYGLCSQDCVISGVFELYTCERDVRRLLGSNVHVEFVRNIQRYAENWIRCDHSSHAHIESDRSIVTGPEIATDCLFLNFFFKGCDGSSIGDIVLFLSKDVERWIHDSCVGKSVNPVFNIIIGNLSLSVSFFDESNTFGVTFTKCFIDSIDFHRIFIGSHYNFGSFIFSSFNLIQKNLDILNLSDKFADFSLKTICIIVELIVDSGESVLDWRSIVCDDIILLAVDLLAESNQSLIGVDSLSDRANARSLGTDHRVQASKSTLLTGTGALNAIEISLELSNLIFAFLSLFSIGIIGCRCRLMHFWSDGLNWLWTPWISILPTAVILVRVLSRGKTNDCGDTECSFHLLLFNSDRF